MENVLDLQALPDAGPLLPGAAIAVASHVAPNHMLLPPVAMTTLVLVALPVLLFRLSAT